MKEGQSDQFKIFERFILQQLTEQNISLCISFIDLTNFSIFFLQLLKDSFGIAENYICDTPTDGKLFNLSHLKEETKVKKMTLYAAVAAHNSSYFQFLMVYQVCTDFRPTISLKK